MDVGNERLQWTYTMDVAGHDLSGIYTISQGRVRAVTEIIVKDNVQYTRLAGEGWVREPGVPTGMPGDMFETTDVDQSFDGMEYVGLVNHGGRKLHYLRLPQVPLAELNALIGDQFAGGLILHDFGFDLWIRDDGRPRSAAVLMDGTVVSQGVELDLTVNFDYIYSRWGEPVTVEAPEQFTDPDRTDG